MDVLLAQNLFWNFLSRKAPTSAVISFLKNHDMEKKWIKSSFWIKKIRKESDFETSFYNASDFESRISKYVRFLVNFKQLVIFGIQIFTACQILKHHFTTRQILIRNVNNFFATPQAFLKKIKNFVSKCKLNIHIPSEIRSRL